MEKDGNREGISLNIVTDNNVLNFTIERVKSTEFTDALKTKEQKPTTSPAEKRTKKADRRNKRKNKEEQATKPLYRTVDMGGYLVTKYQWSSLLIKNITDGQAGIFTNVSCDILGPEFAAFHYPKGDIESVCNLAGQVAALEYLIIVGNSASDVNYLHETRYVIGTPIYMIPRPRTDEVLNILIDRETNKILYSYFPITGGEIT